MNIETRPIADANRRRVLACAALWICAALPGRAQAAHIALAAAIDMAGRQRMLSQRIVKAYCQVGLGVVRDVSRAQLTSAIRRFDAQLLTLRHLTTDKASRAALARVDAPWQRFKRSAQGRITREGARTLATHSEAVLLAAHAVVVALQDAAGTPQARLVNIAGRQRMLSQRLAKLYMLRAWGVDSASIRDDMDGTATEFSAALETLRGAPENTPAITAELDAVALQWEWFRGALELQGAQSYVHVVADASESILNSFEIITAKYAALGLN